jgi:hypothetical protein
MLWLIENDFLKAFLLTNALQKKINDASSLGGD